MEKGKKEVRPLLLSQFTREGKKDQGGARGGRGEREKEVLSPSPRTTKWKRDSRSILVKKREKKRGL